MNLRIHDRRPVYAEPTGEALLTIEHKGAFSLSTAAVAALRLKPTDELVLVDDLDTNTWYLALHPVGNPNAFELRPRDKDSKALMFCSQPRARLYYQAHGLGQQKSVRALVSATPLVHEGLSLYPLAPQHPTQAPAVAAPAAEVATPSTPEVEQSARPVEADVLPLPTDLPFLEEATTTLPMVASTSAPVASTATPTPATAETTEERMERLTDFWYEKDIKTCEDAELAELYSLLADKPKKERDIVENTVLNICKTERARRAKKGGARG